MTTAIRYYSKFGHSKQMAEAISEVCGTEPQTVSTPLTEHVDVLFLGAGIFLGKMDGSVEEFVGSLKPDLVGRVVCYASSAIVKNPASQLRKMLEKQGIAADEREFNCKGSMGPLHSGHPDAPDLETFKAFVRQVME